MRAQHSKLHGAVIGFGFIAALGHAPAYEDREDVVIAAVCDVVPDRVDKARRRFPQARGYTDFRRLLAEERHLDFVDIATPSVFHAEMISAALDADLHVLVEKPLATTLGDASAVLRRAQDKKRVVFPCHNYRHAPVAKAIREVIDAGRIGRIGSITLSTFRPTHALGVPEWNPDWRRFSKYGGGGVAMDHGSHSLYLAFDWLGAYPTAITAKMANLRPDRFDTEDNFTATLTFPAGLANLYLSWTAGVRKVIYTLQGDKGALTVDDDEMQLAVMHRQPDPVDGHGSMEWAVEKRSFTSDWMDSSHSAWFGSLFDEFVEALGNGDVLNRNLKEAWLCVQAITQAYESARDGCHEMPLLNEARV
jgi:predicted dehydrogenase